MIEYAIVRDIEAFRLSKTGERAGWYAGITAYPLTRREAHKAKETDWIERVAASERNARDTEAELHRMGYDGGGGGGGDTDPKTVYAYRKTFHTRE